MTPLETEIAGERVLLDPRRALFWPAGEALFIADTHFGKDASARRLGVPVPEGVTRADLSRLDALIADHRPETVWILGDVFDSSAAGEPTTVDALKTWLGNLKRCSVRLIPGNHDERARGLAEVLGLTWDEVGHQLHPWCLMHEPAKVPGTHVLCGHIHPGVRLSGSGRQVVRLPSFRTGPDTTLLPAFSEFTGLSTMQSDSKVKSYMVLTDSVRPLPA